MLHTLIVFTVIASSAIAASEDRSRTEMEVYVSQIGDDKNDGSKDNPMQTLAAALEAVRGNGVPTTIWLTTGEHLVGKTIRLTARDSRSAEAPLRVQAMHGGGDVRTTLTSGTAIDNEIWRKATRKDRLFDLLSGKTQRSILVADLSKLAAAEHFPYRPDPATNAMHPLLFWNGFVLQQAQWPNLGYENFDKTLDKGPTTRHLKKTERPAKWSFENPTGGAFTTRPGLDMTNLEREFKLTGDIQIHGYISNDWYFQKERVGKIEASQRAIQLARHTRYGVGNQKIKLSRRYRIVNAVSQLDQPGEWYFDHAAGLLYFWPVQPLKPGSPNVNVTGDFVQFEATDVNHISFEGLTCEGFGSCAIEMKDCHHVKIAGCTFRSGRGAGVRIQGTDNTIQSCDFHDLSGAMVMSGYESNRKDLVPEGNRAINNHIHHCRAKGYGAISVTGVGAYFAHNVVHHMDSGLRYGANDFVAEYNEFYEMGHEMGDWNSCYNGADLSLQNNEFRYNFFHHFLETPNAHPIAAIRADDGASGLKVHSNVFYKTGRAAVQFHGPNCGVTNNFVMGMPLLVWTLQKPRDQVSKEEFMRQQLKQKDRIESEVANGVRSFNDKENMVAKAEAVFGREGWKNNKAWINKYPNFAKHFNFKDFNFSPWAQTFAVITGNYMDERAGDFPFHIHGDTLIKDEATAVEVLPATSKFQLPIDLNANDLFIGPDEMDFRFKRQAKLIKGTEKFDFSKVGLVKDQYRTTLPDKSSYRKQVAQKYRTTESYGPKIDMAELQKRFYPPAYLEIQNQ